MKRIVIAVLIVLVAPVSALAQEEDTPHWMVGPDEQADMDVCGDCHDEALALQEPKRDICVMCHDSAPHVGAGRHLEADAAAVARLLPPAEEDRLPLADDGTMYCGTCHLFHDPRVIGEPWLDEVWLPAASGLPQAIRQGLERRWRSLADEQGEEGAAAAFTSKGTRALRLPVADGTLCRRCHGTGG